MSMTYLKQLKEHIVTRKAKFYISLKCAQWDKADLESAFGLRVVVEPWPVLHPQYGEVYTMKEEKHD